MAELPVTAAFSASSGRISALAFLPNFDVEAYGHVIASRQEGGLDLYDIDGVRIGELAGPALNGLATAPRFQLRGEDLPLAFGVDPATGTLSGYAIVRERGDMFPLPLAPIASEASYTGLCFLSEGPGYVDLVLLSTGTQADIVRVRDTGDQLLSVDIQSSLSLPFPARRCATLNDNIYTLGDGNGVARTSTDGEQLARGDFNGHQLTAMQMGGTPAVLMTRAGSEDSFDIQVLDADTLDTLAEVSIMDGLSTPGLGNAGPLVATDASYGFTAYSTGLIAVYDRADDRIKVIARDTFVRSTLVGILEAEGLTPETGPTN